MMKCQTVDLDFINQAPLTFESIVEVDATPAEVFEVLADVDSWPKWFSGMSSVEWLTPAPHGVGSRRQVCLLGTAKVAETFLCWQPGQRFCFRFDSQNTPLAKAAIEDIQLQPLANNRCQVTYRVHMQLPDLLAYTAFAVKPVLGALFKKNSLGLKKHLQK